MENVGSVSFDDEFGALCVETTNRLEVVRGEGFDRDGRLRALHTSAICGDKRTKIRNTNVRVQFSCKLSLPSFFFLSCCELRSDWTTIFL